MEVTDELISFVGEPFKTTGHMNPRRVLPSLDRFHTPRLEERKPGTFDPAVGPEKWLQFLDKTGLESSVLFPTEGLAYGQVAFPPWAIAYAKAYNDWLHTKYLKFNSRLKGIALIPLQDGKARHRLRRAVKELGMVGAMLPSNGLNLHLSAQHFWPVHEKRLLAARWRYGGCYGDLGFNTYMVFPATRALGMPVLGYCGDGYGRRRCIDTSDPVRRLFGRRHQLDSNGHRPFGKEQSTAACASSANQPTTSRQPVLL
jgi:predicted TIM-barrel fold metal-dependent hydrolase